MVDATIGSSGCRPVRRAVLVLALVASALSIVVGALGVDPVEAAASTGGLLDAGGTSTCAVTAAGGVRCWGANGAGQLGNGTSTDASTPVDVSGIATGATNVSAGGLHTCAVVAGGARCWGHNGSGQLGNGTNTSSSTPVGVSGLSSGVAVVAVGDSHTCAVTTGGAVKCWGLGSSGQLGNGSTTNSPTPVAVTGLSTGVVDVAVSSDASCALTSGGAVRCWGRNDSGQLGNGTTTRSSTPVDVTGLGSGVASISMGSLHACAATTAGAVRCWGYNAFGQLGNDSTTRSTTPVAVSGLSSGATAVAAGAYHSCALVASGGVTCWGRNNAGQLGDATTTTSKVPIAVAGLSSPIALTSGSSHTCALLASGGIRCWGIDSSGQLGDGRAFGRHTSVPVAVTGMGSGASSVAVESWITPAPPPRTA
ncbi:MAG: hypothetical protein R2711_18480 [Acidimicrobiales bacterium]